MFLHADDMIKLYSFLIIIVFMDNVLILVDYFFLFVG